MHKTLLRQLKHSFGELPELSPEWSDLLHSVSETYEDFDRDRLLIERSLEISSTELKELVTLLQATIDSINEGILVLDEKGIMINHNKRFTEIFNVPGTLVKSQPNNEFITNLLSTMEDPETAWKDFDNANKSNADSRHIVKFKDGRTVESNSKPHIVDGRIVGRVWSFRDITDFLKTENELKVKLSALERLNNAMIDRELKMVELKKQIKLLEGNSPESGKSYE